MREEKLQEQLQVVLDEELLEQARGMCDMPLEDLEWFLPEGCRVKDGEVACVSDLPDDLPLGDHELWELLGEPALVGSP